MCYTGIQEVNLVLHFWWKDVYKILSQFGSLSTAISKRDPHYFTSLHPLRYRMMEQRPSLWYMSPSSALEKDDHVLSILSYGRRMSPGSSLCHTSPSLETELEVSKILSQSQLFVLTYGGGCLQDLLTVTPLRRSL